MKSSTNSHKGSNGKKVVSKNRTVITSTVGDKTVSFRKISAAELKATRNSAYSYLVK